MAHQDGRTGVIGLTPVQWQLLDEITRRGGCESLFALAADLGLDYAYAWECLYKLRDRGFINISRGKRARLRILPREGGSVFEKS